MAGGFLRRCMDVQVAVAARFVPRRERRRFVPRGPLPAVGPLGEQAYPLVGDLPRAAYAGRTSFESALDSALEVSDRITNA
jgi:hypothetical protein